MLTIAFAGLLTGLTLIVAIGAQNAFVLRQGIRREHVGVVVVVDDDDDGTGAGSLVHPLAATSAEATIIQLGALTIARTSAPPARFP